MLILFSVISFFSFIVAVISVVVWIVQKIRHRETKAREVCMIAMLLALVSGIVLGVTYDGPTKENVPPTVENEEPAKSDAQEPTGTPADTTSPVTTPEPEDTPQTTTEPPEETEPPVASEPVPVNLPMQERPVMNGTGTERIGTWACIITTKEYLATITGQVLYEHLEAMSGNDYNWVNVTFGDGTGLYCYMDGYLIEYGCVDETEGGAVEPGDGVEVRYFHFDSETGTYIEDE